MKIQRKYTRSITGICSVSVTVTSDDGIKATITNRTTYDGVEEDVKIAERQALNALKQLTDARQEPVDV